MEGLEEQKIGDIVAQDYRTADVFKKFGLDFCCGGKRTVSEACEKKDVDVEELTRELQSVTQQDSGNHNYSSWSPSLLINYIIERHHDFVRSKSPEIESYARKVAKVHGKRHEELNDILEEFLALKEELLQHLEKEENVLFPYIKTLTEAEKNGKSPDKPPFGTVENPVAMMEQEHDEAGEAMERIQKLSDDFTPPEDACTSYRVLFQNLEGFQDDLHKHVHLENNVLFPKALELEKRLN